MASQAARETSLKVSPVLFTRPELRGSFWSMPPVPPLMRNCKHAERMIRVTDGPPGCSVSSRTLCQKQAGLLKCQWPGLLRTCTREGNVCPVCPSTLSSSMTLWPWSATAKKNDEGPPSTCHAATGDPWNFLIVPSANKPSSSPDGNAFKWAAPCWKERSAHRCASL